MGSIWADYLAHLMETKLRPHICSNTILIIVLRSSQSLLITLLMYQILFQIDKYLFQDDST